MTVPTHPAQTRAAYDLVAVDYAEQLRDALAAVPLDRALLAAFAEMVRADGPGTLADLGCGPGRITAHLAALGLNVFGVDLSPAMIAVARKAHPDLRFEVGSMTSLTIADGSVSAIVAWYSIIHTPPGELPVVFGEFNRILAPRGRLLLAFQMGDERVRLTHGYGHDISLDAYRLPPDRIAAELGEAGFSVTARMVRERAGAEKTQQAYLLADRS